MSIYHTIEIEKLFDHQYCLEFQMPSSPQPAFITVRLIFRVVKTVFQLITKKQNKKKQLRFLFTAFFIKRILSSADN